MLFSVKTSSKTKQQTVSAMFIIKFNKMIRNKWIWGAFAMIVALSFAFSDLFNGGGSGRGGGGLGTLGGKPVDLDEYEMARRAVAMEAQGRTDVNMERDAWMRLAALAAAEKAGINVPDQTVGSTIANTMRNITGGAFDRRIYLEIIRNMGYGGTQAYEESVRRQIAAGVLERSVSAAAFVSPAMLENTISGLTDIFTIRTATLTNSHAGATVALTDEEVRKYYDVNNENWREPERRAVVYAEFAAADFRSEVAVAEDEILDYYDANPAMFSEPGTNGVDEIRPLEDVRKQIEDTLSATASKEAALRRASDFADVFYTSRDAGLTFESAAAAFGVTVVTSGMFSAGAYPVRAEASPAFVDAAFALEDEGAERFSDAVDGGEAAYVIGWRDRAESHIPDFETVKARVAPRAQADRLADLFRADADAAARAFEAGKESGTNFAAAAAARGLALSTNFTVSYMTIGGRGLPGAEEIIYALPRMNVGDFSTVPVVTENAAVFVELNGREPGDEFAKRNFRQSRMAAAQQNLAQTLLEDWRKKNLLSMDPRPVSPFTMDDAVVYDDEAEDH